ncbi:MAG: glycosyltransferase [Ignavibacteriaceae bacterium]|nr:glycosyltransferase family 2 protein [Ignavibacteria bacterium]NNJ51758.1 glycosyltransferase [Ignavibacteriaceae bacterium]NNL21798.1 glycosyltransferase [Ignavibacteriaceae bacterium]
MAVEIIFYSALFFSTITTIVSIYNFFTVPRIKQSKNELISEPLVSILVPARNEEQNIANCISDVYNQTYQNYELIILDDESEDRTASIIKNKISDFGISQKTNLISGKPIPKNWIGKNWACHQLSLEANGKYLVFMDADVRQSSHVIESCLKLIDKHQIQLLTCFPTQIIESFGEWLIVPLMNFLLLTFLPLIKVYSSEKKSFVAANGQLLLIERNTYDKIGGHREVASKVVEDMEIARNVKKFGFKMMTYLGENSISCRMYTGFRQGVIGFTKNFYSGFNLPPVVFALFLVFLLSSFFLPFLMIFVNSKFIWVVLIIIIGRISTSLSSKQNLLINVLIHPVQIILMIAIGISSVYKTSKKTLKWKGRYI